MYVQASGEQVKTGGSGPEMELGDKGTEKHPKTLWTQIMSEILSLLGLELRVVSFWPPESVKEFKRALESADGRL